MDYQARDAEIVDYQFYQLPGIPKIAFRGPAFDPRAAIDFFTCIGASQTLGVFSDRPFPKILSGETGHAVWNCGVGGAGPQFFTRQPELLKLANRGKFVVLQVMAARSESNSRFEAQPYAELLLDRKRGDIVSSTTAWRRVHEEEPDRKGRYIKESQESWKANMAILLEALTVPVILFWFSPKPYEAIDPTSLGSRVDAYPQLIDSTIVNDVRGLADAFAACLSARNRGHELKSRFNGDPVEVDYSMLPVRKGVAVAPGFKTTRNEYYPSPEMHQDAAIDLIAVLKDLQ